MLIDTNKATAKIKREMFYSKPKNKEKERQTRHVEAQLKTTDTLKPLTSIFEDLKAQMDMITDTSPRNTGAHSFAKLHYGGEEHLPSKQLKYKKQQKQFYKQDVVRETTPELPPNYLNIQKKQVKLMKLSVDRA